MKNKTKYEGVFIPPFLMYLNAISILLMHVVCREYVVVCSIAMTLASWGVYLLLYALRKKHGFAALAVFAMICASVVIGFMPTKPTSNGDTFLDFVFTASSFFDPLYAMVVIVIFSVFMGQVCAYFSVYNPRPSYILLPALAPLILSARTAGGVPEPLLIYILASFAICAASISRGENHGEHIYITDRSARKQRAISVIAGGIVVAVLLAVIPRSDYTPQSNVLDEVFSEGGGYYARSSKLSDFLANSAVNRGANKTKGNVLFAVKADEPINITRWAFDQYNGSGGWTTLEEYNTGYANWQQNAKNRCAAILLYKLKNAAKNGALPEYEELLANIPYSYANGMYITSEVFTPETGVSIQIMDGTSTKVILHPSDPHHVHIVGYDDAVYRSQRDELFVDGAIRQNASYLVNYYSDQPNEDFIKAMESVDFSQLLADAVNAGVITNQEMTAFVEQRYVAREYHSHTRDLAVTDRIRELAEEITEGLTSDYDKALAIEQWFFEEGFVYDLDFVPAKIDVEYFLFESKRGICSDFATATTLLARAADIPARYTEGFALTEEILAEDGLYYVTDAEAHAYTTLYLDGYGWLEIDATKYSANADDDSTGKGIIPVIIAVVIGVCAILVIIFRRQIGTLIFTLTYSMYSKEKKIRAVYLRTRNIACAITGAERSATTTGEVRDILSRTLGMGEQADYICSAADVLFYGGTVPDTDVKLLKKYLTEISRTKRRMRR